MIATAKNCRHGIIRDMENRNLRFGSLFLWVIFCLQTTYSGFLILGKIAVTIADKRALTRRGFHLFIPERELPIYALGVLLALSVVAVSAALHKRGGKSLFSCHPPFPSNTENLRLLLGLLNSILFTFTYLFLCNSVVCRISTVQNAAKILLGVSFVSWLITFTICCNEVRLRRFRAKLMHRPEIQERAFTHSYAPGTDYPDFKASSQPESLFQIQRLGGLCLEIVIPILLFLIIYIPQTNLISGNDFATEQLHHIDYFFMAPVLGFAQGGALGTDVYCQYGVGYPVLFSILARVAPLTYSTFITFSVLYGWLYFVGVYLFLRILLKRVEWAALGVLIALSLQLFHGVSSPDVLWQYPSSTVMRSPCDIWFLISLLRHAQTKSRYWLYFAAIANGLAIFFETDTGVYLMLAFGAYLAISKISDAKTGDVSAPSIRLADCLLCGVITLFTLGAGLWVASRGTLFSAAFFTGWLEVFRLYPSGISMLPLIASQEAICISFLFLLTYLLTAASNLHACILQSARRESPLLVAIAIFGMCLLLQFIGRSHPFNLYHASIPLSLLLTWYGFQLTCKLKNAVVSWVSDNMKAESARSKTISCLQTKALGFIPTAAIAFLALGLLNNDAFRNYPNLLNALTNPKAKEETFLLLPELNDIAIPMRLKKYAEDFHAATQDARRLTQDGKSVMFIVNNEPIYHLASGSKAPYRYAPLLPALMSKSMLRRVIATLEERPVDYAFIAPENERGYGVDIGNIKDTHDSSAALADSIYSHYSFKRNSGRFEIWMRNIDPRFGTYSPAVAKSVSGNSRQNKNSGR